MCQVVPGDSRAHNTMLLMSWKAARGRGDRGRPGTHQESTQYLTHTHTHTIPYNALPIPIPIPIPYQTMPYPYWSTAEDTRGKEVSGGGHKMGPPPLFHSSDLKATNDNF